MKRFTAAATLLAVATPMLAQQPDYGRAEQMLTWNTTKLVFGDAVTPRWLAGGDRFWYRTTTPRGAEFVLVEPATATRRLLFDNARLAAAMSAAGDSAIDPARLPFRDLRFGDDGRDERTIEVVARARRFTCDIVAYRCTVGDTLPSRVPYVRSPDGKWEAFVARHDVWVRPTGGGDSTRLTTDGVEGWGYGVDMERAGQIIRQRPERPAMQWSPDSRRLAVGRTDERNVGRMWLYSSTSQRPKAYSYPYALPGDSVIPLFDTYIIDVAARRAVRVDAPPQTAQANGITGVRDSSWISVRWGAGSDKLYLTHADRGPRKLLLLEADAATGATRVVAGDSSRTYVELNLESGGAPNWRPLANGDRVWFSERDGWGHLYRYGPDGRVKNAITTGPWTVGSIAHVDEATGTIWFTGRGREAGRHATYAHLYRARLDGTGLTLLTPENGDHTIAFAPNGKWFVDTYSRVDVAPVTVLRSAADGRVIRELERADISRLVATGWKPGEPFVVKARDGLTDLHGVMWKPSRFDSTKKYPVLDHIYPGPQIGPAPTGFFPTNAEGLVYATMGQVQAVAELGFIVVSIDHMGTPLRSKAFHDAYYAIMGDNGLPDHIAAIKQLAARTPQMDLEHVGIYGHSGGGFASTDAILRYPDFFKVAVSTSGNHDNRTYYYGWGERYQGLLVRDTLRKSDNYENQVNYLLAKNLKGKLFLMHGDMDDNVHPSMTIQVADALIKANKSFDLLIVPNIDHGLTQEPYVIRRSWDFFVRNLRGEEPPAGYELRKPDPTP